MSPAAGSEDGMKLGERTHRALVVIFCLKVNFKLVPALNVNFIQNL